MGTNDSKVVNSSTTLLNVRKYIIDNNITKEYINKLITESETYHFDYSNILISTYIESDIECIWFDIKGNERSFLKRFFDFNS